MGKRNLNLELFVVVSWMNSWVSPFIIPDIICFGFFTLDTRIVKFFMKLGVKFHSFFLEKKGEIFVPFTLFEKWKWNENDWKSRSRSESEIKMTRDRDWEVKFQKNSREFSRIETLAGHWSDISPLQQNIWKSLYLDISVFGKGGIFTWECSSRHLQNILFWTFACPV